MAVKSFPKTLYVVWEESDDDPFLVASEHPETHAAVNGKVRAGVYELKYSTTITADVEVA